LETNGFGREFLSLRDLSPDDRREALIRISKFVIRCGIGEIRSEMQDNVVEMALFLNTESASLDDVLAITKETLLVDFPSAVLRTIVSRLQEKNSILYDGKYQLSPKRRNEIQQEIEGYAADFNDLSIQLSAKMRQLLSREVTPDEQALVMEGLLRFLSSVFIDRAHTLARLIAGRETPGGAPSAPPVDILDRSLQFIADNTLGQSIKSAILELLRDPTESIVRFLLHLNQNLVCIEILNLDPECQAVEKAAFSRVSLLVDTNVLISLLCISSREHLLTTEVVELTKRLGTRLLVTERTLREFMDVLEDSNRKFQSLRIPRRFYNSVDDEFIASYAAEKQFKPQLTWEGYYLSMKQAQSILRSQGIELYEGDRRDIPELQSFSDIATQVSRCYAQLRDRIKRKEVAEHDAYHLILVRELRKENKDTMIGPSHWFLTLDQTLPCADPLLTDRLSYQDKTMSTMLVDTWIQMIEPFLVGEVGQKQIIEVFSELLKSQFSQIPFRIGTSTILQLQGDWLNYEWLGADDIEKILGDKFVRDYMSRMSDRAITSEEAQKLTKEVQRELEVRVDAIADEKITDLTLDVSKLKATMKDMETREEELKTRLEREDTFRREWRSRSGKLGMLIMIIGVAFAAAGVFLQQSVPYFAVVISVFFIGGVILIFFAIAPERVDVDIRADLGVSADARKKAQGT
jgi:hypothetical protein